MKIRINRRALTFLLCVLFVLVTDGCRNSSEHALTEARATVGGDPQRGRVLLMRYGCGGCHRIPGVIGAAGKAAPSLEHLSQEPYISGNLPNTPENVIRWIQFPHSVLPKTKMPEMGVSSADARDITTYLWSLR
jgi:cytochrome c1